MSDNENRFNKPGSALAILCLVFGIVSLFLSIFVFGIIFALIGLALGIIALRRNPSTKAMLWTGIGLSGTGLVVSILLGFVYFHLFKGVQGLLQSTIYSLTSSVVDLKALPGPPPLDFSSIANNNQLQKIWEQPLSNPIAFTHGDWDLDGTTDIEVELDNSSLLVFDLMGKSMMTTSLPATFTSLEYGVLKPGRSVVLGYSNMEKYVTVVDNNGQKLWQYKSETGVYGARWGDLDSDGFDEMVIGLSSTGGLHALNNIGKEIWKDTEAKDVRSQAIVPDKSGKLPLVVVSESTGVVRLYGGNGKLLKVLHPLKYTALSINAMDLNGIGTIQIAAQVDVSPGQVVNVAMDTSNNILWKTEVQLSRRHTPGNHIFSHGDLDGDGYQEWAFLRTPTELAIVSGKTNQPLYSIPVPLLTEHFSIINRPGKSGLLCVLEPERMVVYEPVIKIPFAAPESSF